MANDKTVLIASRLPIGLILEADINGKLVPFELQGLNCSRIIGAAHMTTEVDAALWNAWKAKNAEFPAYVNKSFFEASSDSAAESITKDLKGSKKKTGVEAIEPDSMGVKPDMI